MVDNKRECADLQHIYNAFGEALQQGRTFSDIWIITSQKGEDDKHETVLTPITLIIHQLPTQGDEKSNFTSLLITYNVEDGEEVVTRTFAHILVEDDKGLVNASDWIKDSVERAMSGLYHSTYNTHFAITEHITNIATFTSLVKETAINMLDNPESEYDVQYRLPAIIAGILRVKGEHPDTSQHDYARQLTTMNKIFKTINNIK